MRFDNYCKNKRVHFCTTVYIKGTTFMHMKLDVTLLTIRCKDRHANSCKLFHVTIRPYHYHYHYHYKHFAKCTSNKTELNRRNQQSIGGQHAKVLMNYLKIWFLSRFSTVMLMNDIDVAIRLSARPFVSRNFVKFNFSHSAFETVTLFYF